MPLIYCPPQDINVAGSSTAEPFSVPLDLMRSKCLLNSTSDTPPCINHRCISFQKYVLDMFVSALESRGCVPQKRKYNRAPWLPGVLDLIKH